VSDRILVVDDEPAIADAVSYALRASGFEVDIFGDGESALEAARSHGYDVLLLDVRLPGLSGIEICRRLRSENDVPILILTAMDAEVDRVLGLEAGADDYVTKPFSVAELVARVEALLRRSGALASADAPPFVFGPWHVDPVARTAVRDGAAVILSAREVQLLALFARERGRIVSRRRLLVEVWGFRRVDGIQTRTVDVHIAKLRRKIGGESAAIETVRGEGYRFVG